MKLVKQKTEYGFNIFLQDNQKQLGFTFGGNGDLYWSIHCKNDNDRYFIINK